LDWVIGTTIYCFFYKKTKPIVENPRNPEIRDSDNTASITCTDALAGYYDAGCWMLDVG
jgi:hypothetical protein